MAGDASSVWVWADPAPPCPDLCAGNLLPPPPPLPLHVPLLRLRRGWGSRCAHQARICSLRTGLRIPCLFFLFSADSSNLECSAAVTVCSSRRARRRVYLETR
ncbi:hypothetical protein BDA96_08G057000 [Sorghum bicolor]|uniref:Uncharacterized protein n=1 Tax=Sorghum bicolor TaxID=4558 RepID=A0A921U663_SORBI|nr:hypothetical protein BDA96_08G057000 [Sorghum bicolor]